MKRPSDDQLKIAAKTLRECAVFSDMLSAGPRGTIREDYEAKAKAQAYAADYLEDLIQISAGATPAAAPSLPAADDCTAPGASRDTAAGSNLPGTCPVCGWNRPRSSCMRLECPKPAAGRATS